MRPPFETFKGPTCRGSYAFGSACGRCEKCKWELAQIGADEITPSETPEIERLASEIADRIYIAHYLEDPKIELTKLLLEFAAEIRRGAIEG